MFHDIQYLLHNFVSQDKVLLNYHRKIQIIITQQKVTGRERKSVGLQNSSLKSFVSWLTICRVGKGYYKPKYDRQLNCKKYFPISINIWNYRFLKHIATSSVLILSSNPPPGDSSVPETHLLFETYLSLTIFCHGSQIYSQ